MEGARIELDLLALDQTLSLAREDARVARVVEEMSYFAGMERDEIASVIGVSVPTVDRDLRFARRAQPRAGLSGGAQAYQDWAHDRFRLLR